ncbi:MAG: hypothetical protein FWD59_06775 [Micrococcales bacterium]|nr:hypothetical protein [Micrococcales bacterium]
MSNGFIGMCIEGVNQTAAALRAQADRLEAAERRLTAQTGDANWRGDDADHFRTDWTQAHAPAIKAAAEQVRLATEHARGAVEAQIWASQATGKRR